MRKGTSYNLWRDSVFSRDHYICRICGKKGEVHAHHIIGVVENIDLIYDVNNGITLCTSCHGELHGIDYSKRYPKFKCEFCEAEFRADRERRFCSHRCSSNYRLGKPSAKKGRKYPHLCKRKNKLCPVCGKSYLETYRKSQKYCSRACYLFSRWGYIGLKREKID